MMGQQREKVVVAMSGGVDSSVAACLLQQQGYDVIGLFMRVGVDAPAEPQTDLASADDSAFGRCSKMHPTGSGTGSSEGGDVARDQACGSDGHADSDDGSASPTASQGPRRLKQGCCSATDAGDARYVCGMLRVPFYALNFQDEFASIMDYFADEYVRGRTPNPCVVCNDRLKFGKLLDYADAVGAKYVATGHYARIGERDGRRVLMRGRDADKDQSYVLFGLRPAVLDRVLFPVGDLTKPEVRAVAGGLDLPVHQKPDSVEICFVPDNDYAKVVRARRPEKFAEGDVVDGDGKLLGRHKGIGHYTVGQRRGLGIAAGVPIYVTQLNVLDNQVVMGEAEDLLSPALMATKLNFFVERPSGPFRADVKIRYLHQAGPATVTPIDADRVRVDFDQPQRAITPGQAVVFYDGDVVLGGGWIDAPIAWPPRS